MIIGFFGDGIWAHNAFRMLLNDKSINIAFLTVRFDKQDSLLMNLAKENNIPIIINENINSDYYINEVKKFNADLFVSMSFNQIFKEKIYSIPKFKTINCHAGKLPFYRGRNILNWALINDEKEFGITVHYIDDGIDTGDIILQKTFPITDNDDYNSLLNTAHVECANILYDSIKMIQNNSVKIIKQSSIDLFGTYCGIRKEGDEIINWNNSSRYIFNFVRALVTPGPIATTYLNNKIFKIFHVNEIKGTKKYVGIPGQIIGKKGSNIYVKTSDTFIEITEYIYNDKIKVGDRFHNE